MSPSSPKSKAYLHYLLLAFFTLLLLPQLFYKDPVPGLDASWEIALHLAHKYHLTFGKDFTFTYGPLGIFESRHPISVHLFVYLLFDIYFILTWCFILKDILKTNYHAGTLIYLFFAVSIAMYNQDIWYPVFFLYYLFSFLKTPSKPVSIVQIILLSLLCFYYKWSLGAACIFIFVAAVIYVLICKRLSIKAGAILLLSYFLLIFASAQLLNVSLPGYISSGLHLVDSYNDAMLKPLPDDLLVFGYEALFILLILIGWVACRLIILLWKKELVKNTDEVIIYFMTGIFIYVVFKNGFVRAGGHILLFFKSVPLLAGLFYLYRPQIVNRKLLTACCCLVLGVSYWAVNTAPGTYYPYKRILNLSFLPIKINEIRNYFDGLVKYNAVKSGWEKTTSGNNELKQIIGTASVDVVPTEISKIFFNGLRYNPRPIIQSYSAYDRFLDSLNSAKYRSADGPEYILFTLTTIDDRFAFFDESLTKLAILDHYAIMGEVNGDLLLKKKAAVRNVLTPARDSVVYAEMGKDILLAKSSELQFSKVFIDYTFWGKLRRLLYRPPVLKITFTLDNGETKTFKAVKPIMNGGVILNKYVDNVDEFQALMLSDGRINTNVRKIRFESDPQSGFDDRIKISTTYYARGPKSPAEVQEEDRLITEFLNKYKPIPVDSSHLKDHPLRYNVEGLMAHSPTVSLFGWAFNEGDSNQFSIIKAVLRSKDRIFELPTKQQVRTDLNSYFDRTDLDSVGFSASISKAQLPDGNYQLGIAVLNKKNGTRWVQYTDDRIAIKTDYKLEKIPRPVPDILNRGDIKYSVEIFDEREDQFFISGWAFLSDVALKETETNVVLQGSQDSYRIPADMMERVDLVSYFKNKNIGLSGFSVTIPKNKLPKGIYEVGIEKVYPGGRKRSLVFAGKTIRNGIPQLFIPVPVSGLPPAGDARISVEVMKDEQETSTISGWAVPQSGVLKNSRIEIVLKGEKDIYTSDVEPVARPDVTAFYKNKSNLDYSGFHAKISKDVLQKGKYQVGVRIFQDGNKGIVAFTDRYLVKE